MRVLFLVPAYEKGGGGECLGDAAVATAWQLRLMALRFVAGLLSLVVLYLGAFFSLVTLSLPFCPSMLPLLCGYCF